MPDESCLGNLSEEELEKLKSTVRDEHRYVKEELLDAFVKEDGMFYQFLCAVRTYQKELAVAFRGNSKQITIYYHNNVLWNLEVKQHKRYVVSVNFDHARYDEDWEEHLKALLKLFNNKKDIKSLTEKIKSGDKNINITWEREKGKLYIESDVTSAYEIMMQIMDSYFNIEKQKDWFREKRGMKQTNRKKESYVEKRWQQRLFRHFKDVVGKNDTDIFVYDLEFSQKYPNSTIRGKIGVNEPDLLAVRFENGVAKKLVLIEVKSTKSACQGKSGIKSHMEGMKKYADEQLFVDSRRKDVLEILKQYQKTGLYPQLNQINIEALKDGFNPEKDIDRVILFTNNELPEGEMTDEERKKGGALYYYKKNNKEVRALADEYKCKIWITENNYFDDKIEIKCDYEPQGDLP